MEFDIVSEVSGHHHRNTSLSASTAPPTSSGFEFTDYRQRIAVSVMLLAIFLIGVVGNALVLVAVVVSQKLQTSTNAFVVCLSVTDLFSCLVLPFQVVNVLSTTGPLLPDALCGIIGGIAISSAIASVITLALIAINRCIIITTERRTYEKIYSTCNVTAMVLFSWVFPLASMVLPQVAGFGRIGYTKKYKLCLMDGDHSYAFIYEYLAAFIQLTCFIIIVVTYGKIYRFLRQKMFFARSASRISNDGNTNRIVPTVTTSFTDQLSTSQTTPWRERNGEAREGNGVKMPSKREIQITRNLFYVICGFFVSIVPYAIAVSIPNSSRVLVYMTLLLCASSIINPIIYGFNHPHFRVVFRTLLRCDFDRIPEPSPLFRALRK
ncbi:G-protein coupled receptor moody-like [Diadema antillarum]|uniref:G-protein coupled receptor moody-like n=1 Tax=Diadema antillarum TaxID=105358 RepID=UPI003A861C82